MLWKPRLANSRRKRSVRRNRSASPSAPVRILGKLTEQPLQSIYRSVELGPECFWPTISQDIIRILTIGQHTDRDIEILFERDFNRSACGSNPCGIAIKQEQHPAGARSSKRAWSLVIAVPMWPRRDGSRSGGRRGRRCTPRRRWRGSHFRWALRPRRSVKQFALEEQGVLGELRYLGLSSGSTILPPNATTRP